MQVMWSHDAGLRYVLLRVFCLWIVGRCMKKLRTTSHYGCGCTLGCSDRFIRVVPYELDRKCSGMKSHRFEPAACMRKSLVATDSTLRPTSTSTRLRVRANMTKMKEIEAELQSLIWLGRSWGMSDEDICKCLDNGGKPTANKKNASEQDPTCFTRTKQCLGILSLVLLGLVFAYVVIVSVSAFVPEVGHEVGKFTAPLVYPVMRYVRKIFKPVADRMDIAGKWLGMLMLQICRTVLSLQRRGLFIISGGAKRNHRCMLNSICYPSKSNSIETMHRRGITTHLF